MTVPLDDNIGPLKLCFVIRTAEHPDGPGLVHVVQTTDGLALLGAIVDAGGSIERFVEIWMQDTSAMAARSAGSESSINNATLDARWKNWVAHRRSESGPGVIVLSAQDARGGVMVLDLNARTCTQLRDWSLCTDDAELTANGLPEFTSSAHRYLRGPGGFAAVFPASPMPKQQATPVQYIDDALGLGSSKVAVGSCAGYMAVTPHLPLSLEQLSDWLAGRPQEAVLGFAGTVHTTIGGGKQNGETNALHRAGHLGDDGLLTDRAGRISESLMERLAIKLRLWLDVASSVADLQMQHQAPLLCVRSSQVRVNVMGVGEGLPWAWTARAYLTDVNGAPALGAGAGSAARLFLPDPAWLASEYSPVSSAGMEAEGRLRVRTVSGDAAGTKVEATLETDFKLALGAGDLLRLSFGLAGRRVVLTCKWEPSPTKARNELLVTSLPEAIPEASRAELAAASKGKTIPGVGVDVLQMLGTSCDLYAVGVIGMRLLLVDGSHPLGVTIDDIKSLAARLGEMNDRSAPLPDRIADTLRTDAAMRQLLGVQRLVWAETREESVAGAVSGRFWSRVLALLVRTQLGYPDSECLDTGDSLSAGDRSAGAGGASGGMGAVFRSWRKDLYTLVGEARGLIFRSAGPDAEIAGLLRNRLVDLGDRS